MDENHIWLTETVPPSEIPQKDAQEEFLDRIYRALWDFGCAKRVVLCHPDDEDRVRAALDASGAVLTELRADDQFCQPGEAILLPSVKQSLGGWKP